MQAIRVHADDIWARAGVYYVRTEAMVLGFDIPLQGEFDTDAPETEYVLVEDENGKPVSTCRLHILNEEPGEEAYAKIERVATVSGYRGKGAGRLAIEEAERWIREKGIRRIVITSRDEAVGFYERLGYSVDTSAESGQPAAVSEDKEEETQERHTPRFVIVRMEKIL